MIVEAARARFLAEGYTATSIRAIARDAGVDHAAVKYHFGTKSELFGAVLAVDLTPSRIFDAVLGRDPAHVGEALVATLVAVWDQPEYRVRLQRILADALSNPEAARFFREYIEREVLSRVAGLIGGADATKRAAGVAATIGGLIFTRYALRLEPMASMSPEDVVRYVGPAVDAALTGRGSRLR
ncbi:MAG TPA: TetR family transcriptional regulator [Actinomycetales bacterium]|nr:TetR family transcriptional regulator [Actinomycetales bacterium]